MRIFFTLSISLFIACTGFCQSGKPVAERSVIRFYPNPAVTQITFDFTKSVERSYTFQVFNFLGKKVFEQKEVQPKTTIDPPAFTKSRETIQKAITGYKEINLRGMKLIKPGGFLVTTSCTNLVQPDLFLEIIQMAAKDAKRTLRQVVYQTQASDHPIVWGQENTHYLKFLIVQVV